MNENNKSTKLQRVISYVLTILFIPLIFGFGIYGVFSDFDVIKESVRYSYAQHFMANPEKQDFFPVLKARIQSLENQLGKHIPYLEELGVINAGFQYGIGKQLVMAGSQQLLSLPGGQIYNLTSRESLRSQAEEVVAFYEQLDGSVPFLFSYVNAQFYEGSITLPAGYDVLDTGDELADEVLSIVREAGIEALDSREFLADTGYTDNELMLSTDMHWTTLAGIHTAQVYAQEINRLTGANLDISRLDMDQFETELYPELFLGEYGQQVGAIHSGKDDITLYWPTYETSFTRHTVDRDGEETTIKGSFKDAVIKWDALDNEPDGTNIRGYIAYGLVERIEEITNHGDCEDITILMFRDSYSAPVGSFLSLMAKNVVMVDMRTARQTAMEFVEQYDPDIVVFSHSRQMYEDHGYSLGV